MKFQGSVPFLRASFQQPDLRTALLDPITLLGTPRLRPGPANFALGRSPGPPYVAGHLGAREGAVAPELIGEMHAVAILLCREERAQHAALHDLPALPEAWSRDEQ